MKAKSVCTVKKSIKVVIGVWILSFILATPTLLVQVKLTVTILLLTYFQQIAFQWKA